MIVLGAVVQVFAGGLGRCSLCRRLLELVGSRGGHGRGRRRLLGMLRRGSILRLRGLDVLNGRRDLRVRARQVNVARRLGIAALRLDKAGLQTDDIVAQRVVLGLDGAELLRHLLVVLDLVLERLDVFLLALAESSLCCTLAAGRRRGRSA